MSKSLEDLKTELAKLPENDRAKLASFLLRTLPPPPGILCEDDDDLEATLARRIEEMETGKVIGIPLEKVIADLRDKFPKS